MMIAFQKPDATHVAGFHSWKNKFERKVNKGEKGIKILAPSPYTIEKEVEKIDPNTMLPILKNGEPIIETQKVTVTYFKVVNVFDISQTSGKELPEIAKKLDGEIENYKAFYKALKEVSPVPILLEEIPDGANGYYSAAEQKIGINKGMSELQSFKTMIHEIAHAKLHDDSVAKRDSEVQAESVAYAVCRRFGIDTSDYSFEYIAAWSKGKELSELKNSLEIIRVTASDIITQIDSRINVTEIEVSVAKLPEQPQPVNQNGIIGNAPFRDIKDKQFFNYDSQSAVKIIAALESRSVPFSGKVKGGETTLIIGAADVAVYNDVCKSVGVKQTFIGRLTAKKEVAAAREANRVKSEKSAVSQTVEVG
jgi:hypothetical protein